MALTPLTDGMSGLDCRTNINASFTQVDANVTAIAAKLPLSGGTLTGQLIQSVNGAASTPPVLLTGTIFTGGSATTTKPAHLIEPTGTTSTGWSTNGTIYGGNAPSGFAGNLIDLQVDAGSKFRVTASGTLQINNSNVIIGNGAVSTLSLDLTYNGGRRVAFGSPSGSTSGLHFYFEEVLAWTNNTALAGGAPDDLIVSRADAGILAINGASAGASLELMEMTAPSAPAANKARIYAQDNGAGKTQLMVLFPSGVAQQIAIEP